MLRCAANCPGTSAQGNSAIGCDGQSILDLAPQKITLFATEIYRRGQRSVNVYRDDKLIEQLQGDQTTPPGVDDGVPPGPPPPAPMPPLDPLNPPPAPMPPAAVPAPAPASDDPFRDDPPANPTAPQP